MLTKHRPSCTAPLRVWLCREPVTSAWSRCLGSESWNRPHLGRHTRLYTSKIILDAPFSFYGQGLLESSNSELSSKLLKHLAGILRRGIGPSQGLYLHRTAQHRRRRTHIHASSGIRTHDPSAQTVQDCARLVIGNRKIF
jgi:hypothetical protein